MSGPTFNQTHSGSGDNVINYGKQPSQMTDGVMSHWLHATAGWAPFHVTTHGANPASRAQAEKLLNYLVGNGRPASAIGGVMFDPGIHQHVTAQQILLTPGGGPMTLFVDADK